MTGTVSGALGGLLAFGLVRARTPVLTGWQFLFLVEAIPTLVMKFLILLFLPSFPFAASFLTPREKAVLQARLNKDHKPQSHGGMSGWEGFKAVMKDINAWGFMLIYASLGTPITTVKVHTYLFQLINELGFSSINAQGLTVAPYVVGFFMVVLQAWHSDKTRTRGWHIMLSSSVSCIGYIILACLAGQAPGVTRGSAKVGASYFALFLVISGNYSLFPLVMSWAANNLSPTSKRGVGTAFVVSVSNTVSIASPQIYFDPEDSFRKGHAIAAGCLFLAFLVAFSMRTRLEILNKRNKRILSEMSEQEREELDRKSRAEVYDLDPRFVFMT
ncbi:hypothetical protein VKT23_008800 [Stygiomarasmius scandens]|uniref:MFS transporter n=1 Tax=Marasmiellus scandens TaxID=2682957 RepID=A0ABR1JK79_9AGAR